MVFFLLVGSQRDGFLLVVKIPLIEETLLVGYLRVVCFNFFGRALTCVDTRAAPLGQTHVYARTKKVETHVHTGILLTVGEVASISL